MSKIETTNIHRRANRLIGQLKGVVKMVEAKRSCTHILLQIAAIKSAVNNLGLEIAKQELGTLQDPELKKKLKEILQELSRI